MRRCYIGCSVTTMVTLLIDKKDGFREDWIKLGWIMKDWFREEFRFEFFVEDVHFHLCSLGN